jgi:hypothetical protein
VIDRNPEDSDHDIERRKQHQLELLVRRTTALPLGRGMLTLSVDGHDGGHGGHGGHGSLMHDVLPMPPINLSGRVPPSTATIQLDLTQNGLPLNCMEWVRFHNGVAAGLRIAPRVEEEEEEEGKEGVEGVEETEDTEDTEERSPFNQGHQHRSQDEFTRTWISYNRLKTHRAHEDLKVTATTAEGAAIPATPKGKVRFKVPQGTVHTSSYTNSSPCCFAVLLPD